MVQVISNLGHMPTITAPTLVRPIFVSLGFAGAVPIVARFVVLPFSRRWGNHQTLKQAPFLRE